jgi:hypothetical protein
MIMNNKLSIFQTQELLSVIEVQPEDIAPTYSYLAA